MHAMPDRINQPAIGPVQLRVRPVLRPAGGNDAPQQSQSISHAGSDSTVQDQPKQVRDHWFAERAWLGTPLSAAEVQHGVNAGIISSTLLM